MRVPLHSPDFTATSILEKFQNETATASVDRVLKKLASKKAEQMMAVSLDFGLEGAVRGFRVAGRMLTGDGVGTLQTREPKLPSSTFVASYLGAFRPRELGCDDPPFSHNGPSLADHVIFSLWRRSPSRQAPSPSSRNSRPTR
jgi:hypothetical protein